MSGWTNDELSTIDASDELRLASARRDGTLRNPVTIWAVRIVGSTVTPQARAATLQLVPRP